MTTDLRREKLVDVIEEHLSDITTYLWTEAPKVTYLTPSKLHVVFEDGREYFITVSRKRS